MILGLGYNITHHKGRSQEDFITGYFLAFLTLPALLAMGSAGAGLPAFLAAAKALVLMFFRGLVFPTALRTFLLGSLSTARILSDLRRLERSVLAILGWGRFQPFFSELGFFQVP